MTSGNSPKTLLQISGAPTRFVDHRQSALILIDYQMEYVSGALPLPNAPEALSQAGRVLERFRALGQPVFHVVHHAHPAAALFDPESSAVQIADPLTPIDGETVIVKSLPNAFTNTDLQERIEPTGLSSLTICGFMTHMCVSSTVRAAAELGYRNTVIANACATRDLPDPLTNDLKPGLNPGLNPIGKAGGKPNQIIPAKTVHHSALAALNDRFAVVARTLGNPSSNQSNPLAWTDVN